MGPSALLFKKLLDQYIECVKSGEFPGAEVFIEPGFRGHRIMSVDAPTFNTEFKFYK